MEDLKEKHCDEYVWGFKSSRIPSCAQWFLFINRQPAVLKCLAREMGVSPKLFADYKDGRVRVVMASRLGHIGITEDLEAEHGYSKSVYVEDLSNFSDKE